MKKLFLALLAVASIGTANAQKNTILVFGNAGVNTNNDDNGAAGTNKMTNWNVSPGVGYQFNNHLTVGLQGGYGEGKNINDAPGNKNTYRDREWQLGAFFRYTQPLGGIFAMFTQVNLGYVDGLTENESIITPVPGGSSIVTNMNDKFNGFAGSITPAIGVNVHKGLALNFSMGGLGYRTVSYDKMPTTSSNFYASFGQQFNLGISKNFGCSKSHRGHHDPGMEHRKMKKHDADDDDE